MGGKMSPIIIGVLVAVVIAIALLIVSIVTGDTTPANDNNKLSEETVVKPTITLGKDTKGEEKPKAVTIVVEASIEDGSGIAEIVLPDDSKVVAESTTYEVTENGTYEFTAVANNGEKASVSIDVTEIEEISAENPYVPEGFSVIEDSVEEGFVIEDGSGNQYVWIPVENGKLERETKTKPNYDESSGPASSLVNSVAKYYGFYLGRVEASQYEKDGETVAASMLGKVPWTNITYFDALENATKSAETFGYTDCHTSLLNSYALDTALLWINKSYENYSSSTNYGNYSGTIHPTGQTESDEVKHIFDLAGNVREWTTEIYKELQDDSSKGKKDDETNVIQRVVRSGGANIRKTPASRGGYPESSVDPYWGFRLILYK